AVLLGRAPVGVEQIALVQHRVRYLAGVLEMRRVRGHGLSVSLASARVSSASRVMSQVGSARADLKRCNSSRVRLLILIQALFGKWASMASRQTETGSR